MRFVFRAEASLAIGSGHVMRSSAIAEEVIARGIPAVFVGTIFELPWVSERIQGLGFIDIFDETNSFESDSITDILILDSYDMPISDSFVQPSKWRTIVSIFDESTPQYQCGLRVHPGLTTVWPQFSDIKTISGPTYTPLRKTIKVLEPSQGKKNLEVVVVGGGADITDFVSAIATVLLEIKTKFHAHLFVRDGKTLELDLDERFSINPIGKSLDEIANKAELVFTTASTTSLEFIARGCAVAVGCAVDNQEIYYKELGGRGFAAPIGEFLNDEWHLNEELIQELVTSKFLREEFRTNSADLIDLNGAKRIVDEILKL